MHSRRSHALLGKQRHICDPPAPGLPFLLLLIPFAIQLAFSDLLQRVLARQDLVAPSALVLLKERGITQQMADLQVREITQIDLETERQRQSMLSPCFAHISV